MRATTIFWAGAACASLLVGPTEGIAQNSGATPAERPPERFSGLQYVDSAGCVFMRAGRGDAVTWVPRVTRAGEPLCGYAPTLLADAAPSTQPAPVVQVATQQRPPVSVARPEAVQATSVTSVAAPRSGVTRTVPAVTVAPSVATTPKALGPCDASLASAGGLVGCDDPAVETANADFATLLIPPQTRNSTHGSEEIGVAAARPRNVAPPGSATYSFNPSGRAGTVVTGPPATIARLSLATQRIAVPRGYKEAWEDGRLNVFRGLGTAQGTAQMRRTWTETVPQRLR